MSRRRLLLLAGGLALVLVAGLMARTELGAGRSPDPRQDGVQLLAASITGGARAAGNLRSPAGTAALVAVLTAFALLASRKGWSVPAAADGDASMCAASSASRQPRAPPTSLA